MNGEYVTVNGMRWGHIEPLVPPLKYEDFADTQSRAHDTSLSFALC